ncbi:MAG: hypothetical protein BMS9Abin26_1747 [Gammaproteobacteria bacterium]|nr:MAG: hypothetical protein BMS9Abin26_1747 [Gammaproteobacteria bacterium]
MADTFVWKSDRPWPNVRLKTAAIVGHTTSTSTRLWFRTGRPGTFTIVLYPTSILQTDAMLAGFSEVPFSLDDLPAEARRISFTIADYSQDTTYVVDIDQLSALTEYGYALHGRDDNNNMRILLGQDRDYTFRTLPDTTAPLSFGFYSCHMPYKQTVFGNTNLVNMEMWDCFNQVLTRHYATDLHFVIGGGDQVYVDGVKSLSIWKFLNKVMRKEDGTLLPDKDAMVSWYRDIHRGYWGFRSLQKCFSRYPTYMMWDDHELGDGWGSYVLSDDNDDELDEVLPALEQQGLSRADGLTLLERMAEAGKQAYEEYQHSHNPVTPADRYDYHFTTGNSTFYFLDGRGNRDINRQSRRVLGSAQYNRFKQWLAALDPATTQYLFVVSAVPMVHLASVIANADDGVLADIADMQDDLRDAWEHKLHDSERRGLLRALFDAADRGIRICILSGDVHTSAAFRLTDDQTGKVIYQLTSSAITYNKPRLLAWLLGKAVADEGHSDDGYTFERLALYTDSNFSIVKVDPDSDRVWFQLYGKQTVSDPYEENPAPDLPMTHALTKLELRFD